MLEQLRKFALARRSLRKVHAMVRALQAEVLLPMADSAITALEKGAATAGVQGIPATAIPADRRSDLKQYVDEVHERYGSDAFDWALKHDVQREKLKSVLAGILTAGRITGHTTNGTFYVGE
jgi:hypothetical protein